MFGKAETDGRGWGGSRVGAGRPRKSRAAAKLTGLKQRHPGVAPVASGPVVKPDDLSPNQAAVWEALAPHAEELGRLTPATAWAFRDLCEAIILKRAIVSRIGRDGIMLDSARAAHPLLAKYLGLMVRVETGLARFGLNPTGMIDRAGEAQPDEFAEFATFAVVDGGKR